MKRLPNPPFSFSGEGAVAQYRQVLRKHEDPPNASWRHSLSGLRHFVAWYEANSARKTNETASSRTDFDPQSIMIPALTRYHTFLQKDFHQKPHSVKRGLISVKRYDGWAMQKRIIPDDPSAPVKLVGEEEHAPRHLEDEKEQALGAAVTNEKSSAPVERSGDGWAVHE